jgi:acyl-CoA dehydrogenase
MSSTLERDDLAMTDDLLDGLEAFARAEVLGRHERHAELLDDPRRRYDESGRFVPEVVEVIRDLRAASAREGWFNLAVPEHLGGAGLGHLAYFLAWERVYATCPPSAWLAQFAISHWAYGPSVALDGLTERAHDTVWPGLLSGRELLCFGLSEPDAGSDAMAMRTKATPVDGGWMLNGRKIWTTHATIADWMVVFAVTDPEAAAARKGGISAFLVPTDAPGLDIHAVIKMWGEIGGTEGETALSDVFVEPWQLIGPEHKGFRVAMKGVSLGRLYNSARAVASGTWAVHQAVEHAQRRTTFGQPLSERQAITHPLAEATARLHAARLAAVDTAQKLDAGLPARRELAMSKYLAVDAGNLAVDRAIQTFGAIGFTNELGFIESLRSMRSLRVADGTDEILLRTVYQDLQAEVVS